MTWGRSNTASPAPGPIKPRSRAHSFFLPSRARRLNAGGAANGPVPALPTEQLPSLALASTSYTTTTERTVEQDAQHPQSPWWPDAVRVKPRRRSAQTTANNDGRVPSSSKHDEADEFTCCGLSASPEAGKHADDDEALGLPVAGVDGSAVQQQHAPVMSFLQRPDDAFYRTIHPAMTKKPVASLVDPLEQLYNHDEDSLDMADLLDNTLIPMVMSPYTPRSAAMSPGSSASTYEASPRSPTVSPPYKTTALPAQPPLPSAVPDTSPGSLERSARHARSMPSLGLAFRSTRRKRPVDKAEAAEAAPAATTATVPHAVVTMNNTAPLSLDPKQDRETVVSGEGLNALHLVMGPPASDTSEYASANSHRLRRPTEAPAIPETSPLRVRRHKPPLTIAPLSSATYEPLSCASGASTPLLSPSTPTSGTLRARRSKASLKVFTVSSPPPCPPPTTPLPQLPATPIIKSASGSDGHQHPKASMQMATVAATAAATERTTVTSATCPSVERTRASASDNQPASIGMREVGRALSTASSSSVQSKATHSSPHFSMRSYESYQTSPASITKMDITTQQPSQQLMAMTGQQIRQLNRQSFLERYTPRSSIGLRDSRQSMASIAMLVGDESTMASNGNHASLSKSATPAAGSDRSSISSLSSGVAAIEESALCKNVNLADSATQVNTSQDGAERTAPSISRGRLDATDGLEIGLAF